MKCGLSTEYQFVVQTTLTTDLVALYIMVNWCWLRRNVLEYRTVISREIVNYTTLFSKTRNIVTWTIFLTPQMITNVVLPLFETSNITGSEHFQNSATTKEWMWLHNFNMVCKTSKWIKMLVNTRKWLAQHSLW